MLATHQHRYRQALLEKRFPGKISRNAFRKKIFCLQFIFLFTSLFALQNEVAKSTKKAPSNPLL